MTMEAVVSQHQFVTRLLRYVIRLFGVLLIVFLVIQVAPGGPVDQFFFQLWERSIVGDGGAIR